jgi:hypothetical protein
MPCAITSGGNRLGERGMGKGRYAVRAVRSRQSAGEQILRSVWLSAGGGLPGMRDGQSCRHEILWSVRCPTSRVFGGSALSSERATCSVGCVD